jgi:hypothetical protein
VWSGVTEDGGYGILVVHNNKITGTIEAAGRHYLIEPVNGGAAHRVREIDTEAYPQDIHLDPEVARGTKRALRQGGGHPQPAPDTQAGAKATITYVTLLVTYTAKAKALLGATLSDKIKLDIALVNQGMSNSRVQMRIKLAGIRPVQAAYDERASSNAAQPLYDITYGTGYNFSALRATRTSLAADLVTMYVDRPEYCGIAWVLYPGLNADYAFSAINAACQGTLTLAHELGHNMGLYHDRYVEAPAPSSQFNFGFVSIPGAFRTIMSYSNKCTAAGISCTRITYYSTPTRSYLGLPVGIPAGQPGAADAARLLRANTPGIAAFR